MNFKDNKFFADWKLQLFGTFILAMSVACGSFLITTMFERFSSFIWIWPILIILLLFILIRKRIPELDLLYFVIIISIAGAIIQNGYAKSLLNYISYEINMVNIYSGIETRKTDDTETYDTRWEGEKEGYVDKLMKLELYKTNDSDLETRLEKENENNEEVNTIGFLFWQTGYAEGFNVSKIDQASNEGGFYNNFQWIISIVAFSFVEIILFGALVLFPISLILYYLYFCYSKELLFKKEKKLT